MAQTRGATGHSKPRSFPTVSTEPAQKRTTKTTVKKPVTKRVANGGVTKSRAPATHHKRKSSVKDKIGGAVEKAKGVVERKPGKKAAGTKKIKGTDGKNSRAKKAAVTA